MARRRSVFGAAVAVLLVSGPASAQHHGGGHPGGHAAGHPAGTPSTPHHGGHHHHHHHGGFGGYYGPVGFGYGLGYGYGFGYGPGYGLGYNYGLAGYSYPIYGGPIYGGGLGLPYNTGYYVPPWPRSAPRLGAPDVISPDSSPVLPSERDNDLPVSAPSTTPAPAKLTVIVPDGGQVWFDNTLTPTSGNRWVYTSPQLEARRTYTVAVKARWGDGDQARSFEMPLRVQAGDDMTVDLTKVR